ncbi:hypothetical protein A2926_04685 [Candidatus Giovannonibacteria bacterium RIFCSPLOWO2_01_FULL_44_40]|uniref:Uncharacterized protein n=1 Tax=Candidatus Giovannonibacteria bacterium RIFCSPHIGHO2_01_FULL_45_23 TaxID=1798325 RepID=A0A1F5VJ97_9BACT|nr:MAG: hypothetical protein A2834_03130 [Candidatus Giovannonibacteria bacterium RIFCSPHIGHO2_01_FULL_45_23]OGF75625.1 MAG: hypothetical protein A3C77_00990 [Candidatus Giovannonibacteria bacterium RIFCSPHIGHO2_02_FULL_45_13]OGF80132.1 MAG: hypothetical protein A2926_04685 [Candidatus Giovannonibacteria bacterium RIFCSPLOWO2_01_FULL_44_40]
MWYVKQENGNEVIINPAVELHEDAFGSSMPQGSGGEVKNGHVFYQVVEKKNKDSGEMEIQYKYIAFAFGGPTLKTATQEQFEKWKSWQIIAKPAKICWQNDEKGPA